MNYHFPRTDFAKKIINALSEFENATTFSFMLFDSRRKGKTTFLLKDIKPLAEEKFYVFYFSFMGQDGDVIENFRRYLRLFFDEVIFPQRKVDFLVNLALLKVTGKSDNVDPQTLSEIFQMIKLYSQKPVLFLFDEFQEIGRTSGGEKFIMTLRTVLDQNRECFKSIFTGSSFYDINAMFNHYSQPFYKFGPQISLSPLPDDFVLGICEQFKKEQGVDLNQEKLLAIFHKNDRVPFIVIEIIQELIFFGEDYQFDVDTAYEKVKGRHLSLLKGDLYEKLNPLDRAILKWIILEGKKVSSDKALTWLAQEAGGYTASKSNVLASLNKMKGLNIIQRGKSQWSILNRDIYNIIAEKI